MEWSWALLADILPLLARGALVTFEVTALGSLVAFALGLVLALLRRNGGVAAGGATRGVIEFVRSTPLLVQAYFFFGVLPAFGLVLEPFVLGVIVLGIHYATYAAEVYRAGIEGVPEGQWEAATALNLPRARVWRGVILPQAVPRVLPALGNYVISMFKEVPVLYGIGLLGVASVAINEGSFVFSYTEPLVAAGLFFLVMSYPSSLLVRRLERRFGTVATSD